jgi:dTDP-4-amino-4,6-dideoxygalactose transaminase
MILFNDFNRSTNILRQEIDLAIKRVLDSGWFILGKETERFEANFAQYLNAKYCVGVANGTEAIALAIMANEIEEGDEVITTNLTAYPTITGILQAGAIPVVIDIRESDGLIDCTKIEEKITEKTKAIVPVHLYGQSCDMDPIVDLAKRYHLKIIEDCAQSAGAEYKEKKCGTIGQSGAFSFYPTKNLGALGDAGAIVTNDLDVFQRLLSYRNYGQTKRYHHETKGINSRMDEIQAAILSVKLQYLDQQNLIRNKIAAFYRKNLKTVECLSVNEYGTPVHHLFVIKTESRDLLMQHLLKNEIQTLIHYPIPIHHQNAFIWQKEENLEHSVHFADTILSIPLYPELHENEVEKIVNSINEFII